MSQSSSECSETDSIQDGDTFIDRLGGIPVIKSAFSQASSIYHKAKQANTVANIGLSLAEMSIKTAVYSTKFAYNAIPAPGFVGTLKEEAEKKVVQVDALACKGLDILQKKCPAIMCEPREILSAGSDKIEKSDMIEAALIVSEAAVDYLNPTKTKKEISANTQPTVVSNRKVDRLKNVSQRTGMVIYHGGSKVVWGVMAAPWYATEMGLNMARQAAVGTALLTRDIVSSIPGFSALVGQQRKPRRSNRRRVQTKPNHDSSPFPISPDKKRKRSNGDDDDSDSENLYEMLYVKEYYASDEDPDYFPEDHDSDTSDTVEPSEEEGDSGEGDEVEISDAGGQSFTADQVKKSVRFQTGRVVHGPQGSLVVHITETNKSTKIQDQKSSGKKETVEKFEKYAATTTEKVKEGKMKKADEVTTKISPKTDIKEKEDQKPSEKKETVKNMEKGAASTTEKAKEEKMKKADEVKTKISPNTDTKEKEDQKSSGKRETVEKLEKDDASKIKIEKSKEEKMKKVDDVKTKVSPKTDTKEKEDQKSSGKRETVEKLEKDDASKIKIEKSKEEKTKKVDEVKTKISPKTDIKEKEDQKSSGNKETVEKVEKGAASTTEKAKEEKMKKVDEVNTKISPTTDIKEKEDQKSSGKKETVVKMEKGAAATTEKAKEEKMKKPEEGKTKAQAKGYFSPAEGKENVPIGLSTKSASTSSLKAESSNKEDSKSGIPIKLVDPVVSKKEEHLTLKGIFSFK